MNFKEWFELNEIKDACYYKVKRRYRVFPSAYSSGALVQCRKKGAANWGNSKKNENEILCSFCDQPAEFFDDHCLCSEDFSKEKEQGLHGWFSRKTGGWIDCKASHKGHLVPCGRKQAGLGAEREYPACRPVLSMCNKHKHKKKGSKRISWQENE